jgi:hypothetical protein
MQIKRNSFHRRNFEKVTNEKIEKKKLSEIFMTNDGQSVQATHLKHFQFILDFPFEIIIPQNVGYTFFLLHI